MGMGVVVAESDILAALYPSLGALDAARARCGRHGVSPLLEDGWFAVPSKDSSDRLIYDRRPRNAVESRLDWVHLPHGTM